MSNGIRVVVVDDHTLFRRGLMGLLSEMQDIQVVGDASNGKEALAIIAHSKPDLVLLDVNMPIMGGVETVKALRLYENCRIIMLTISEEQSDLIGAIRAGADGYLLKNTEPDELRNAIFLVMEDKSIISPAVTREVFRVVRKEQVKVARTLTEREIQVLHLLSRGLNTPQLMDQMSVSENTLKTHIRNIFAKLDVSSRADAVSKASQLDII